MTAISSSADAQEGPTGSAGRDAAVIAATAVGGIVAVVISLAWSYSYDLGHRARTSGHVAPVPYWSPFVLVPLVAFVGGRLAPERRRAVVAAACAGQVLLALASHGALFFGPTWFAIELWVGEVLLVALTWAAATGGRALARR